MSKGLKLMTAGLVTAIVISLGSVAAFASNSVNGSTGALADTEITLEEMLVYAIQDEYAAQAEYAAIIKAFGNEIPYTNIIRAEENHISRLTGLFDTYGFTLPVNNAETSVVVPESLEASYAVGVTAEEKNIAMYEKFLKETLSEDAKAVFERLLSASKRHLLVFQNAVDGKLENCIGTGNMGRGQGNNGTGNGSCNGSGTRNGSGTGIGRNNGGGRGNRGGMGLNGANCLLN